MSHRECTETNQPDFVAGFQRISDDIYYAVDSACGIFFGKTRIICDCCNKIVFIQRICPPKDWRWNENLKDDVE